MKFIWFNNYFEYLLGDCVKWWCHLAQWFQRPIRECIGKHHICNTYTIKALCSKRSLFGCRAGGTVETLVKHKSKKKLQLLTNTTKAISCHIHEDFYGFNFSLFNWYNSKAITKNREYTHIDIGRNMSCRFID